MRLSRIEMQRQTRQRLLDSAQEVFARHGFVGASVDEIAGATKALLRGKRKAPGAHPVVVAITKALAADKTLRGVTVRRVGQRTSLANIDDAAWPALKRALRGLKLPVG